ncbi:phage late control D family protein [Methylovirgula sp. 4M-Z18]|uniref:phage late control D family protein n=1 Tax=Methylovirgula sp. 4M-Z18 TaxID=2293567 RepID=UPI001AECC97F|nr:hypothetical protein [Methylovirgula sp. 4M-Z18]
MRKPTLQLTLAGTDVPCAECSVAQTKKGTSGTFSAKVPLSALDALGLGLDWLATQRSVAVSVAFANDAQDFVSMFVGSLDKADVEFGGSGQMVALSGRDASAQLKNQKTNEKFQNQKHEDIAQSIAGRAGLMLATDGNTGMAGRIYTAEQAKVTGNQNLWMLLREIAEAEGKVHCVVGNTLYFTTLDDPSLPVYPVACTPASPSAAAQSLAQVSVKLGRNFEAAKKHTVNVNSWDHKKKQMVSASASAGSGEPAQLYHYQSHHKTQDQVDRYAQAKLKEHTRHAFDLTIEMPGDTALTPLLQIALTGTNSSFDQNYHIDQIDHKISAKDGYRMTIQAKTGGSGAGGRALSSQLPSNNVTAGKPGTTV